MLSIWLLATSAVGCLAAAPVIKIGGKTFTPNAATQYLLAPGQTLTPGGTAEVDGSMVSLGPSANNVVIANSVSDIPKPAFTTPPPTLLIGFKTVTALPSQGPEGPTYVVGGKPLTPGGKVVYQGSTVSLAPGGTAVAINDVTQFVALEAPTRPPAVLKFAGKTYTGSSDRNARYTLPTFVIEGSTLTPGGEITVDGTPLALASDASAVVYDGKTSTVPASATAATTNAPLLTVNGKTYTAQEDTMYDIEGKTLTPGGAVTVSGKDVSLAPSATALVVDGKTKVLFPATGVKAGQTAKPTSGSGGSGNSDASTSSSSEFAVPGLSAARGLDLAGPLALVAALLGI